MGGVDNLHLTLEQVLLELKKALATIKKEKDLFQKMKQIYRGADMPSKCGKIIKLNMVAQTYTFLDLINAQRVRLGELTTQKSKLQIELSSKISIIFMLLAVI